VVGRPHGNKVLKETKNRKKPAENRSCARSEDGAEHPRGCDWHSSQLPTTEKGEAIH
jgi:hypothetical protein